MLLTTSGLGVGSRAEIVYCTSKAIPVVDIVLRVSSINTSYNKIIISCFQRRTRLQGKGAENGYSEVRIATPM